MALDDGSLIGIPRIMFAARGFVGNGCLSSVDGSGFGFVVVMEDGAGSLLPRAPVSVDEDTAPLRTGFPVILI